MKRASPNFVRALIVVGAEVLLSSTTLGFALDDLSRAQALPRRSKQV